MKQLNKTLAIAAIVGITGTFSGMAQADEWHGRHEGWGHERRAHERHEQEWRYGHQIRYIYTEPVVRRVVYTYPVYEPVYIPGPTTFSFMVR